MVYSELNITYTFAVKPKLVLFSHFTIDSRVGSAGQESSGGNDGRVKIVVFRARKSDLGNRIVVVQFLRSFSYSSENYLTNGRAQFLTNVMDFIGASILRWLNGDVKERGK